MEAVPEPELGAGRTAIQLLGAALVTRSVLLIRIMNDYHS